MDVRARWEAESFVQWDKRVSIDERCQLACAAPGGERSVGGGIKAEAG